MQASTEGKYKLKTLKISAVAIFSVVIVEVSVGLIVNSLAILSDGLHALLDALSTVMLFIAVRAALKPPDDEHPYGHEKFETIGGLIGGIVLIAVAFLIFYEAAMRIISQAQVSQSTELFGFIGIGYALFIASLRVTVFRGSQHIESTSMKAGLYDAISDLSSTLLALVGFALSVSGFYYGDSIASIFLGIMLSYLSAKLVRASIMELSDTASKELVQKTRKIIEANEGDAKIKTLKVRKVSSKIFVDACLQIPIYTTLEDAHSFATKIETKLEEALGNVEATTHIEPLEKDAKMDQLVEKLATVDGVKEVHEISTILSSGKFYITLHAYVNPELSVEEAHKIAENIERKMHAEINQLENVTVHIEPANIAAPVSEVDEEHLGKIINEVIKGTGANLRVKKIVTYASNGKRYINIDCCFIKYIQIKDAHRIASHVEKEIRERFMNSTVTMHIEPECS